MSMAACGIVAHTDDITCFEISVPTCVKSLGNTKLVSSVTLTIRCVCVCVCAVEFLALGALRVLRVTSFDDITA